MHFASFTCLKEHKNFESLAVAYAKFFLCLIMHRTMKPLRECNYVSLTSSMLGGAECTAPSPSRIIHEKQAANFSIGALLGPRIVFVRLRTEKLLLSPGIGLLYSGSPVRSLIQNKKLKYMGQNFDTCTVHFYLT